MKKPPLLLILVGLVLGMLPLSSLAKMVNLYDQPNTSAKVVQTIDLSAGFVPIFTPKEGGWIKVGDPKNGAVGWIKSTDLNSDTGSNSVTVTQQIMNDGKTPNASQVVQIGQPVPVNGNNPQGQSLDAQTQKMNMQKAAQDMIQNMSNLLNGKGNYKLMNNGGALPVVVPIDTPAPKQ